MYMKKIAIVCVCLMFLGISIAAAAPNLQRHTQQLLTLDPTGTYEGYIGIPEHQGQNATIVGTINGTYELRNRGGRFLGDWETENRSGTMRGRFARHVMMGRISMMVNGTERSLPVIGFIRIQNNSFIGRGMSYFGPALYFWGDFT